VAHTDAGGNRTTTVTTATDMLRGRTIGAIATGAGTTGDE